MSISAMKQALEALEKLWDIIDDIDTYGDMAKSDDKLYRLGSSKLDKSKP